MESINYFPLHVHCAIGSVGDSILRIQDYVNRGKELGLNALALTDHGSMAGMYQLANTCKKAGIKPIIGEEVYVCEDSDIKDDKHREYNHLVLLAKNNEGLKNLLQIHNDAMDRGFYYKPRTDIAHMKRYGKGIIALTACVSGAIPKAILAGDAEGAVQKYKEYVECFDEVYLELQPGNFAKQIEVNDDLVLLTQEVGAKLVVTNDIHYLRKEDAVVHNYHVKLGRKEKKIDDSMIYPDTCYWFMDSQQLRNAFTYTEYVTVEVITEGLENAAAIAQKCNVTLDTDIHMPTFQTPTGFEEKSYLRKLCYEKLTEITEDKPDPAKYVDRLERELGVIEKKGFSGYFLVVADYCNWARKEGIPVGPGRGSAAGSLVNYLMGISQPDPIRYGLMFERFLDEKRFAVPDIDVDFLSGNKGRERLFEYAAEKYGKDYVARVSTLNIRHAKGAIRDAARILGFPPKLGNDLAKLIPDVYYGDDDEKVTDMKIADAIKVVPELGAEYEEHKDVLDLAMALEGLPSSEGLHAAGMLISPISLSDKLPLRHLTGNDNLADVFATQLNLDDAEESFVKCDYLSLGSLAVIEKVQKAVGWEFDYQNEDLFHDDEVWDLIGSRNTTGIFQISSSTYKSRMWRLAPRSIEQLASCLALVRGPCISNHTDEVYMQIVEGKRGIEPIDPIYDEITKDTNGILLFQEQILKIAHGYGFEMSEAYTIMKWAQKKKINELKEFRPQFLEKALAAGSNEAAANKVYDMIVAAGAYSFNASHAVSYGMVTYVMAYLKVHYPLEFMANTLTYAYEKAKKDTYGAILRDCHRMGIKFLPADINKSSHEFTVEGDAIRIGFCAIKGLGDVAVNQLIKHRPFANLEDVAERTEKKTVNAKAINAAIFSGVFDSFIPESEDRRILYEAACQIWDNEPVNEINFGKDFAVDTFADYETLENIFYGVSFIYSSMNSLPSFGWYDLKEKEKFMAEAIITKVKLHKAKNGQMAFMTVMTGDGAIEVTVFANKYEKLKSALQEKQHICLTAKKDGDEKCILESAKVAA